MAHLPTVSRHIGVLHQAVVQVRSAAFGHAQDLEVWKAPKLPILLPATPQSEGAHADIAWLEGVMANLAWDYPLGHHCIHHMRSGYVPRRQLASILAESQGDLPPCHVWDPHACGAPSPMQPPAAGKWHTRTSKGSCNHPNTWMARTRKCP